MSFGIPVRNGLGLGLLASTSLATGNIGYNPTPSLNLDFTTMTALPSTITFSRPSNATYYDSTGKLTYAPNNLLTYSDTFTNAAWTKTGCSFSAALLTASVGAGRHAFRQGVSVISNGQNFIATVDVAFVNYNYITISMYDGGTAWVTAVFDLSSPSAATQTSTQSATLNASSITSVSGGRYRISIAGKWQTVNAANFSIGFAGAATGNNFAIDGGIAIFTATGTEQASFYNATSSVVTYETTPRAQDQVITTSAAYYGARLDYNPATLAARGLLIEEARTNLALYSDQFNNAYWGLSLATITTNSTTSPDGTVNAETITATAGAGPHAVFSSSLITSSTGVNYAQSVFVKKGTNRFIYLSQQNNSTAWATVVFDLDGGNSSATQTVTGSAGTIASTLQENVGNGWFRLTLVASITAAARYFVFGFASAATGNSVDSTGSVTFTAVGTETFYAYGAQLELGSFATSYIPTAASSVARSADTASMTGTNFSSWYNATAGAFLVQFDTPASGTRIISAADDNTANNNIQMLTSGTDPTFLVTTSGTAQASIDAGTVAANTVYKFAGTYSANDFAACISGGTVGTDTSGTIPTVDRLRIGAGQAGNTLCGHVALLNYYPSRLPNATLQSLTS